jgi:hypothetical protein
MANSSVTDPLNLKLGSVQIHVPAALPNKHEAGWAPEAVWTFCGREVLPTPAEIRIPDSRGRNVVTIPTELPGFTSLHEDKVKLAIRRTRGRNSSMAVNPQEFLMLMMYGDGF